LDSCNFKADKNNKNKILDILNKKEKDFGKYIYNTCKNCGHYSILEPKTLVFQINFEKEGEYFYNPDLKHDNTLPRTKDYICPNKNCTSHKDLKSKEAIFYRGKNYNLTYQCVNCDESWNTTSVINN
jgi:aspartate carbamoyltransferase regulatory subunit